MAVGIPPGYVGVDPAPGGLSAEFALGPIVPNPSPLRRHDQLFDPGGACGSRVRRHLRRARRAGPHAREAARRPPATISRAGTAATTPAHAAARVCTSPGSAPGRSSATGRSSCSSEPRCLTGRAPRRRGHGRDPAWSCTSLSPLTGDAGLLRPQPPDWLSAHGAAPDRGPSLRCGRVRGDELRHASGAVLGAQPVPRHAATLAGSMGWPQLGIHLMCVGLPIVWV